MSRGCCQHLGPGQGLPLLPPRYQGPWSGPQAAERKAWWAEEADGEAWALGKDKGTADPLLAQGFGDPNGLHFPRLCSWVETNEDSSLGQTLGGLGPRASGVQPTSTSHAPPMPPGGPAGGWQWQCSSWEEGSSWPVSGGAHRLEPLCCLFFSPSYSSPPCNGLVPGQLVPQPQALEGPGGGGGGAVEGAGTSVCRREGEGPGGSGH